MSYSLFRAVVQYWTQFNDFTLLWWQTFYTSCMVTWVPYFGITGQFGEGLGNLTRMCVGWHNLWIFKDMWRYGHPLLPCWHPPWEMRTQLPTTVKDGYRASFISWFLLVFYTLHDWVAILTCVWLSMQKFDIVDSSRGGHGVVGRMAE